MNNPTGKSIFLLALAAAITTALITTLPASRATLDRQLASHIQRQPLTTTVPNTAIKRVGHRGTVLYAPENTLAAFDKAIEAGFDYIELDVRSTRDGVPVVFHDKTVDRTTNGTGKLSDLTWDELSQLDAGSWFDPAYADTRVPSLEEALAHLQGRACVMWDTKGMPTAVMVRLFKKYGFDRNCLLATYGGMGSGDNPRIGEELIRLWPDAPLLLTARKIADLDPLLQQYPQIRVVRVMRQFLTAELVSAAHTRGLEVFTSTLLQMDNPKYYAIAVGNGADFIMLDYIELLDGYIGSIASD